MREGVWCGDILSSDLLGNEPRSTSTLRTTYNVPLSSQAETLVVLEVRECSDQCVCNRVTVFLGWVGLGFHPLSECILSDIITDALAECIEFANLTFCQSGVVDRHYVSFCG